MLGSLSVDDEYLVFKPEPGELDTGSSTFRSFIKYLETQHGLLCPDTLKETGQEVVQHNNVKQRH